MIVQEVVDFLSQRNSGCILYASPSRVVRDNALRAMAQLVVCSQGRGTGCDCANCFSVKEGSHPKLSVVNEETFDDKMKVLHSYPTPIVQIQELHRITHYKQTKLLIWLEAIGKSRFVMMSADSEHSILPTIRSRSSVFTEIPRFRMNEEEIFRTQMFLRNMWTGKERFDSIIVPDDAKKMAFNLRDVVVHELEGRMSTPAKKTLPGSDAELVLLMKVLERFFQNPETHNLKLLMSGFSMNVIQGIRA